MKKTHKILMLIENHSVPADDRVWAEAITLRKQGFQVSMIGPKGARSDQESYICIDGIHIYRYQLPANSSKYLSYIVEYSVALFMTFWLSLWVWRRHGFDAIHTANPPDFFFLLAWFYRLPGKKFVFDQHDLSPEMFQVKFQGRLRPLHRMLLWLEWCSYRAADLVIVPNLPVKRFAIERGRVRAERIFVVYNGPDLNRIKLVPLEPELKGQRRYRLAYVGAMEVQDGVEYTLYAMHDLVYKRGRQDVSLILIGHGGHAPALHTLAHQLQLDEYVNFTGWMKAEDLIRYLSVADVGLTPEPLNGYNEYCTMTKTKEYMAMGKPVVAFDLVESRFTAHDAALYATPNLVEDFANKIETLLDDEELRLRMGAIGRKRIEEELNWSHSEKHLLLAYEMLFSSSNAGGSGDYSQISRHGGSRFHWLTHRRDASRAGRIYNRSR